MLTRATQSSSSTGIVSGAQRTRPRWRYFVVPVFVLLVGLISTAIVTEQFRKTTADRDRERFQRLADHKLDTIRDRLEAYMNLLRGAAGLLAVKPDAAQMDWHQFVTRTRVQELYPGVQGVGFAKYIAPDQRADVERAMRAQGVEGFTIHPGYERADWTAILYLEPLDRRNRAALGFDMFTEPIRRAAMERARDTGRRAMTGKVELVQEIDHDKQPGFLIYVPIYRGGDLPETVEARRARLIGWAYSPFRARDLFSRALAGEGLVPELAFTVFDGDPAPQNLLYESPAMSGAGGLPKPRFVTNRTLDIASREWTITLVSTPVFESGSNAGLIVYVLATGLLMTALLTAAAGAQARSMADTDRAREDLRQLNDTLEHRVEQRTAQLTRAQNALRDVNENLESIVAARTAELELANEEVQRFAYIVSHDLRAPLVNIMGFTSELEASRDNFLRTGALPEDDPARQQAVRDFDESISFIRAATSKMDGLIRAILTISREGRRPFNPEPLDLNAVVTGLVNAAHHQAESAGAAITVGELPAITADRLALEQVLGNLLDNAIKYLDPSRPGRIAITGEETLGRVILRVADNGRGIAPKDHARVFELFRRAGAQDKPGEGIGLAHVKAVVRSLGGRIELASEPGVGTTFTITLPKTAVRHAA